VPYRANPKTIVKEGLCLLLPFIAFLLQGVGVNAQPVGSTCGNPIVLTTLPFNQTGLSTCGFGDDYSLGGGSPCNFGNYLQGQEIVYQLTPAVSGCFNIQLYNQTGVPEAGIFVFQGCPGAGGVCQGSSANENTPFLKIDLIAGTTYYIIIGSQQIGGSSCSGFSLYISDPAAAPPNDFCENAATLTGLGSNYNATACNEPNQWTPDYNSFFNQCSGGIWNFNHNGVWYVFNNPMQQDVIIEVFNIQCIGVLADNTLQLGVWSNTGTCDLDDENFYGCLVTNGDAEIDLNNLPAGDYYLFVDGSSGSLCTWEFASQQVIECVPPQITPLTDTTFTFCSATVNPLSFGIDTTGSQPADITWLLNSLILQSDGLSYTASNPAQGIYTAQITNECGTAQQAFEVVILPSPTATLSGDGTVCANAPADVVLNISLTGTPPFTLTYQIDGVVQPPILSVTNTVTLTTQTSGLYELTALEDANCPLSVSLTGTATVTQTALLSPPLLADTLAFCIGEVPGMFTAANVVAGASVNWYANDPTLNPAGVALFSGNPYNLNTYFNTTLSDTLQIWATQTFNGCESPPASAHLIIYNPPTLSIPPPISLCQFDVLPPLTAVSNGMVDWYNTDPVLGGSPIANGNLFQTSDYINTNTAGSFTFWATAQQNGCTSPTALTTIIVLPLPPIPIVSDTAVCQDTPLPLLQTNADGWVNWYANAGDILPIAQGNTFLPPAPGTYYLQQTDTLTGCISGFSSVNVSYLALPPVPFVSDTAVCQDTALPLLQANANGWVNWYANAGDVLSIAQGNTFLPPVPGTYYLQQTDTLTGCISGFSSVNVSYHALPPIPFVADTAVCQDAQLPLLQVNAEGWVNWYANAGDVLPIAQGNTFLPPALGTYYFQQTDTLTGCTSGFGSVNVSEIPLGIATFSYPQTEYCLSDLTTPPAQLLPAGISGSFSISGDLNIHPQNGTIDLSNAQPGQSYTITFLPNLPCAQPDTFLITVHHLTLPDLPDVQIEEGSSLSIDATALLVSEQTEPLYQWSPADAVDCNQCPIISISPLTTTQYQVNATTLLGCTQTQSFTAYLYPRPNHIILPNAFSPNNDGVNDLFALQGFNLQSAQMYIYNRWGEQVFGTSDLWGGWNGTYENQPAPIGVYVYYAQVTYTNGQSELIKGNLTLIR